MILRRISAAALALTLTIAAAGGARAAAIAGAMYESFNYPAATQFGANSANNGGVGWNATGTNAANAANANWGATGIPAAHGGSAAAKTAVSPGLTFSATGYVNGTGNKFQVNDPASPTATNSIGRLLGGQSIDAGTLYFSYLSEKNVDTARSMNLAFFGTLPGATERFAIGQISGANTSNGNIAVLLLGSNANLIQSAAPIAYGVNTTHLIVGKVQFDTAGVNDTLTVWVDPTDVTTEAAAGTFYIQNSAFDFGALTSIRPFAGNPVSPLPGVSADFDEIRIGGTWQSVVVPEPAAAALLTAGALALAAFRRRR